MERDRNTQARSHWATAGYVGTIIFGGLHAASSLYWGFGGEALIDTVGQGAVEWQ